MLYITVELATDTRLVVFKTGAMLSPIKTVSSENTSSMGSPEMSFTEKSDPDRLSFIEKSSPWLPSTLNTG